METTEKQKFDAVLLRLVQAGLVAKGANIFAPISVDAAKKEPKDWTNRDLSVEVEFLLEDKDIEFEFEFINPHGAEIILHPGDWEVITVIQMVNVRLPKAIMDLVNAHADSSVFSGEMDRLLVKCKFDMLWCFGSMSTLVPAEILSVELQGIDAHRLHNAFVDLSQELATAEKMIASLVEKVGRLLLVDFEPEWFTEAKVLLSCATELEDPALQKHLFLYELDQNFERLRAALDSLRQEKAD